MQGVAIKDMKKSSQGIDCAICAQEKITRGPFKRSIDSAKEIGTIVHSDLAGSLPPTREDKEYMASLIDEATRSSQIKLLQKKSDTTNAFIYFKLCFEKENGCSIKSRKI